MAKDNPAGIAAIATTLFGLMYVPWLLNFIQKINFFFDNDDGRFYLLYFILITKFSDTGALAVRLADRQTQNDPAHQPGQDVGGVWRGDRGFYAREPALRPFRRESPSARHELAPRHHFGRDPERDGRHRRFDRVIIQTRGGTEVIPAASFRESAASWTCWTACCSMRPSCTFTCAMFYELKSDQAAGLEGSDGAPRRAAVESRLRANKRDGLFSLSSRGIEGGEGRGEEEPIRILSRRTHGIFKDFPSPQPSPRSCLTGRGRRSSLPAPLFNSTAISAGRRGNHS